MKEKITFIKLPSGTELNLSMLNTTLIRLKQLAWKPSPWVPRPALRDKNGNLHPFRGQDYDPTKFDLISEGWTHDHCETCGTMITVGKAYTNGTDWLCAFCHHHFLKPDNLDKALRKFKQIDK